MRHQLVDLASEIVSAQLSAGKLASTGGESLSVIWWVGVGLLVVGVAIGVIAFLKRRKSDNDAAPQIEPTDSVE